MLPNRIQKSDSEAVQQYHPEEGMKKIAVAEVAEKYFARAKDATRLAQAVEAKLTEQRRFILWWDGREKQAGIRGNPGPGRGHKTALQTSNAVSELERLGLDRITVHRWRIRLKDEQAYEHTLEAARERAIRICEFSKGTTEQRGASGTGETEWYTPREYVEAARDVLVQIDLDPATTVQAQEWIKAAKFFTKAENGLHHPWPGRVWLNPPYMQPDIANFVEKLCAEVEAGHTTEAILLTHNYTDTEWFHRAACTCSAICFTRGRVGFVNPAGEVAAPTQGQAFFYFGSHPETFATRFRGIGFLVRPLEQEG